MSEKPEDPKKKPSLPELLEEASKAASDKKPGESKSSPELDDAISRLLSRKAPANGGDDSVH